MNPLQKKQKNHSASNDTKINNIRKKIDSIDLAIIKQLSNRIEYTTKIQKIKKELNIQKEDKNREKEIIKKLTNSPYSKNISDKSIKKIYKIIFSSTKK